jgi:hypothetical protein
MKIQCIEMREAAFDLSEFWLEGGKIASQNIVRVHAFRSSLIEANGSCMIRTRAEDARDGASTTQGAPRPAREDHHD